MGRKRMGFVQSTVMVEQEVVEELRRRGFNISELFREQMRMVLENLTGEYEGVAKELSDEVTAIDQRLKAAKQEGVMLEEERKQRLNELNDLRTKDLMKKMPDTRVQERMGSEERKESSRVKAFEMFQEWIKEEMKRPDADVIMVDADGKWKQSIYDTFWALPQRRMMELRFACGFPFMKEAIEWLQEKADDEWGGDMMDDEALKQTLESKPGEGGK